MQECESSFVTKFEADIPTRRGDLGDHTWDGGMVVWGVKKIEVNILAPFLVPLCMQECELSFVTKFKADIPTRRGDLGDHTPPHGYSVSLGKGPSRAGGIFDPRSRLNR